jgi:hypothetical protein
MMHVGQLSQVREPVVIVSGGIRARGHCIEPGPANRTALIRMRSYAATIHARIRDAQTVAKTCLDFGGTHVWHHGRAMVAAVHTKKA